jgi:hypothetical protein
VDAWSLAMSRLVRTMWIALPVALLLAGCGSRERQAGELVDRKHLVEMIQSSPTTTLLVGKTEETALRDACVRAVAKGLTEEELAQELAFCRTELGVKETEFQLRMIRTSLMADYPPESALDPVRLALARELIHLDPTSSRLNKKVTDGIARCAAEAFGEDELRALLDRAKDPLALSVQRKWPQVVTQAFQDVASARSRDAAR